MGLPIAVYGVVFYAALFVLAALLLVMPKKPLYMILFRFSIIGALLSVVFLGIQFLLIKALCIYCIASAVISFMVLVVARDLWKKQGQHPPAHT